MNKHYLKLKLFLQIVEDDPSDAMDQSYRVFSEERLSGDNKDLNHRIRPKNTGVYSRLFDTDSCDSRVLYPLLHAGPVSTRRKLTDYAKNQLPGGIYWELCDLKPNNDICESILGLNDYLTTAIPNMHQVARSNLVEVKKIGTMRWYQNLPTDQ